MSSVDDANSVLTAFHNGSAKIVGRTKSGYPVVKFESVTGRYINKIEKGGQIDVPSNVFVIKGTKTRVSVYPANPQNY
jgi:filamentous hemagglutinin